MNRRSLRARRGSFQDRPGFSTIIMTTNAELSPAKITWFSCSHHAYNLLYHKVCSFPMLIQNVLIDNLYAANAAVCRNGKEKGKERKRKKNNANDPKNSPIPWP